MRAQVTFFALFISTVFTTTIHAQQPLNTSKTIKITCGVGFDAVGSDEEVTLTQNKYSLSDYEGTVVFTHPLNVKSKFKTMIYVNSAKNTIAVGMKRGNISVSSEGVGQTKLSYINEKNLSDTITIDCRL